MTHYCRTREAATHLLRSLLRDAIATDQRVLVGFDFAFSYPAGFAEALGLPANGMPPWLKIWHHLNGAIEDGPDNKNNRFEVAAQLNRLASDGPGPFWGCPKAKVCADLTPTHRQHFSFPYAVPTGTLERLRITERHTKGVQDTWKLMAIGSVGGQVLVGIPRLHQLRFDPVLSPVSAVWPLETGFSPDPLASARPGILYAEIWPGIVDAGALIALVEEEGVIRDQGQVILMCEWAQAHDETGSLGGLLSAPRLAPEVLAVAEREEGWILGCTVSED